MSASHRSRKARLTRQASVMQEIQKAQDKDSLDGRYARLMAELSALCNDRNSVLTADSLGFFATSGRAEPVKLDREPDRGGIEGLQKAVAASGKADDLLSADAARRQRVEELTRFFMEAKSDIEFALGGSREFRDVKDKDKDADGERDEEREAETGDDEDDDKNEDAADPKRQIAKLHAKLLKDPIDNRVYTPMLAQIREQDPALYGAILCHPLVTGVDPKKDKKKKKKRKDRERKEKTAQQPQPSSSMLTPDFAAEPLTDEETVLNVSRFVARSIAEGSIQGLMLGTKLVVSLLKSERVGSEAKSLEFPLASHLRVLRGEKAPELPPKRNAAHAAKQTTTPTKIEQPSLDAQDGISSIEGVAESDFRRVVEAVEAAGEMDMDSDSGSIAKLRARLSRFGDGGDEDEDEDDDDDDQGNDRNSNSEEGVDEDALMARAIALSLSPEVTLKDQDSKEGESSAADGSAMDTNESQPPKQKPRPPKFSPEELWELTPFQLPANSLSTVEGVNVGMFLLTQVNKLCLEYLESCRQGILPNSLPVQPHPLTFMLINSLLLDFQQSGSLLPAWAHNAEQRAKWNLFRSCSLLTLFRVLESHLFHIEVLGIVPASVGLGQGAKSHAAPSSEADVGANPLLASLKTLVLGYVDGEPISGAYADDSERDVVGVLMQDPTTYAAADVDSAANHYFSRVREASTAAWVRGLAIFYSSQQERHKILASKLMECLKLFPAHDDKSLWKFYQLDLLCARFALPDLSQYFVPACVDIMEQDVLDDDGPRDKGTSDGASAKTIDDSVLQNAALKTGKLKAKWKPSIVRSSLEVGTLSTRCLFDYIAEHGPPGLLETTGLDSSGPTEDPRNVEILANTYDQMWEHGRKQQVEAYECIKRLPGVVDLLRESVLSAEWPSFSFTGDYNLVHAPLIPVLEKLEGEADAAVSTNARILLLRSLQDLMLQRLGGSRGDEPPALEFDASRCAETMTLSDSNQTAKQHTAKQWGMVMTTTGCPPNTGIHEWAVRLDRCEKGHIFLGVCTRDASVATYVGGDRQGWGLIGTRALWHNRSKVRGDYGDGFSTGSLVRVRLNTDSGALSFGVDDTDWGIAFDGLTQHGTLYPAIGLYQRDDQVTILPVQVSSDSNVVVASGEAGTVKGKTIPAVLKPFLHHAGTLLEATCAFLQEPVFTDLMTAAEQQSPLDDDQKNQLIKNAEGAISAHPLLFSLVTPLICSLSLTRSYHGLASVLAMQFIPWCTKSMQCIENVNVALRTLSSSRETDDGVMHGDLMLNVAGEWELKSMAAGNIPAQQYQLTITQGKNGAVEGQSSGSFTSVTLNGIVRGTKVCFLESWRQGGTCLVEGRLRADSATFNGSYEDAKSHTSGHIVGRKILQDPSTSEAWRRQQICNNFIVLEMTIGNLLGCFGHALMNAGKDDLLVEGAASSSLIDVPMNPDGDSSQATEEPKIASSDGSTSEYEEWIGSNLLAGGLPLPIVQAHLKHVIAQVGEITGMHSSSVTSALPRLSEAAKAWAQSVEPKTVSAPMASNESAAVTPYKAPNSFLDDLINSRNDAGAIDRWVSKHVGESPFVRLGGEPMKVARRTVCAAMIWHTGFLNVIKKTVEAAPVNAESETRPHENLMHIWRAAQRVIEWAIRAKNSMGSTYPIIAGLVIRKAQFLLEIEPSSRALAASAAVLTLSSPELGPSAGQAIVSSKTAVYEYAERICSEVLVQISRFVESPIRISVLQSKMLGISTRAYLRSIGLSSFRSFVGDVGVNYRSILSTERHDIIQSTFVLASVLQWLSQSLQGGSGGPIAVFKDGDFGLDTMSFPPSKAFGIIDSSHYLSGLGGCGKHLKNDLRESFENLYGYLSGALSRATWAKDSDLQLAILLAWGIIIQPDDHAFLSRVGVFRVLQTVLDEARGSSDGTADIGGSPVRNPLDERSVLADSKKKIVQAALKVVHLLAAQVAHAGDSADDIPGLSELPASSSLSLGSIPLLRKPSGPETLGKSVFHMLYTELKNGLEEMRSSRTKNIAGEFVGVSSDPVQTADPSTPGSEDGFDYDLNDAEEYCYQICTLLYSVSGSPVCRTHLSSSSWLRLLLALVDVNSPQIQRRILKLLRRLLPSLDPSNVKVRYDEVDSFDMDSDEEFETDDCGGPDHASTLINFFFGIVGLDNPPSVAEAILHRTSAAHQDEHAPAMRFGENAGGLAAEVILLLRSLYESEKWAVYLNRSIVDALSAIPTSCVTESGDQQHDAADSDVEMEDMCKEAPSLDAWKAQMAGYFNALSALCVLDGQIEGIHVGGTVKVMPRSGSSIQDIAFRGTRGTVVSYEPEKSTAEVLLHGLGEDETNGQQQTGGASNAMANKPVRIPVDDLVAISEVDLPASKFSDPVLNALLVEKSAYFLSEIKKSLAEVNALDSSNLDDGNGDDSEDDDDMSNDGSSSPSAMDSEMTASGAAVGDESEADSEIASNPSPRYRDSTRETATAGPTNALSEMVKESRLYRVLLSYYGLRASATLLRSGHCAGTFVHGVGARGLMDLLTIAISETPTTAGVGDIPSLEESWLALWSRWYSLRSSYAAPKPPAEPVKDKSKNADIAQPDSSASGPMVQQMMEMGFPKEWCDVALARCAYNVEAAINFCFEHSSDMERLVAQHRGSRESANASASAKPGRKEEADIVSPLLEQLSEMGFPFNWCKKALAANRNNVDAALTWILSNGEALEAEDRREEEAKLRAAGGEVSEESVSEGNPPGEEKVLTPNPLRVVSGQACIGEHDMMVEGLVGGGFASVGAPDCLVTTGRWYYEATLLTNGCIQIGWADVAFNGAADRGDGVGDGAHSWAYDGWRQQKWHGQSSPWGSKWKQGDIVGCGIDVDAGTMIFSLNGKMRSANMGVAFRSINFARGVYPCASFNRRERLQFNLGGSPFKFAPPPGFQPILHVLSDTVSLDMLPKGFGVIGMREDCLEENMGEENYSFDTRYFGRDSSIARGSSSHSRGNAYSSVNASKAETMAEIKAIPDDRIYLELILVTRSLAILQARRALLTLMAKWPSEVVGPFRMELLSHTEAAAGSMPGKEEASRLLDFIKLTAGLSAQYAPNVDPTTALGLSDSDIIHLLDSGAAGRYGLGLMSQVAQSALYEAFSATIRASTDIASLNCDPLVSVMLACISSEVRQASRRQYARIPWDSSDASITASFLQITAESGQPWSDREVLSHPNIFLAEWITSLMVKTIDQFADQLPEHIHDQIRQQMLEAWISSLKSPSLCVKERGATILAGIYQDILPKWSSSASGQGEQVFPTTDDKSRARLKAALDVLPLQRVVDLSQERILREYPNMPVCSRYLQSITELVAAAALAMNAMGGADEQLFTEEATRRLEACRRIEADLNPLDQAEYEEMMAARMEEKKRREAEEAARQEQLTDGNNQEADDDGGNSADTNEASAIGTTNMEVDNSDMDEPPDIALSVIANMASEDSAVAAAVRNRVLRNHQEETMLAVEPPKKTVEFAFQFPEPEPTFDTSTLNAREKDILDAAARGIAVEEGHCKWTYGHEPGVLADTNSQMWSGRLNQFKLREENDDEQLPQLHVGCKVIRGPNWKWRDQDGGEGSIGTVEGISPWSGVDGEGMSVRWPNDSLYTYRWGADGNFDLIHVEVDENGAITQRYPTPKAKSDDEGTFGSEVHLGVLIHLFHTGERIVDLGSEGNAMKVTGVMEFPDYGAAVNFVGARYPDGSLDVQELQMTRGNPDMGWTLRFGTEKWQPGTKYSLRPVIVDGQAETSEHASVQNLRGEYTHHAFKNGAIVQVRGEIAVSTQYLFTMDLHNHFSTLGISDEGMTVTCLSGESRNLALATVGFATGIHYWEVHVDQAEFGSVFIGVCEKAGPPGSQAALASRLNRWHGWGFVNFRATYHNSTERIYGDHFNAGDTIGVRLDMEQGKLSFFMDGIKFGEHIVSDLGVAFDNVKGERHSRTLFPCIGMRKGGDRISLNGKWVSMPGVPPSQTLSDVIDVSKALHSWYISIQGGTGAGAGSAASTAIPMSPMTTSTTTSGGASVSTIAEPVRPIHLPDGLLRESWLEWKRWRENRWQRSPVRPRGVIVDFDTSVATCVAVSNAAGLGAPFLAGDRVRMISKGGQELNQPEEAVIIGAYRGFLWYRVETQGNEGADEGRAWAWYWSASELVELILIRRNGKDMTLLENDATDLSDFESSPEYTPFVPRSELEQRAEGDFQAFAELATRGHTTNSDMQLVERLNTYCASIGVEIVNLKITDVLTPEEADGSSSSAAEVSANARTRSFVLEGYFSSPALKTITGPEMRARCAVLRVLNGKIGRVLPVLSIQPSDSRANTIEVASADGSGSSTSSRSELLSTSLKLRLLRRLVFTTTKLAFWDDVLRATTTSTPLPSDEYEDPREIRVIRINRIQAQPSKLSLLPQPGDRLRRSVFGQLYREMRSWNDSFFRRAYCGKGHGGQRRAFKVKFLGEGVNDYGGPYRAVFEQIVDELQMDNVELPKGELGLLPLLIPCPNRRSGTGSNQDKFLLNPSCGTSLLTNGPIALDLHRFLGKLIGTGVRHGLQMGLDLPSLVWRPLAGLGVNRQHLESVDVVAANNLSRVEELDPSGSGGLAAVEEVLEYLTMSTPLSDGSEVALCANSEKDRVTMANRDAYVRLVEQVRLTESSQQLAALRDGLASVLPMELAPLFTSRELEVLICGRREVDVELLQQCTEYSEGADESMPHIQAFWEVLREMTSDDRTSFLRFVWARSRMPNSAKDFPMNFKLQSAHDAGSQVTPDAYLPHAQTCFFALRLPSYSSKEILRKKLLYAIQNSPNMDADVRLHNAEGWADA